MLTITVKHLQRGQPRPYADHEYRSEITLEALRSWDQPCLAQIRELVRTLVHGFTDDPERKTPLTMHEHFRPRLRVLECLYAEQIQDPDDEHTDRLSTPQKTWSAGRREVWLAEVREPYCD